ncbi:MAG: DUF799 family lipoprotein [Elusimicrobia bacterium]|nr:DUF799 family lipoprotein [Elusimicrobiota bacterium]
MKKQPFFLNRLFLHPSSFILHPSKLYPVLLALFLCGCGNYYSVRIPYYLPANDNAVETKKALSSLYIVVRARPEPKKNALGNIVGALLKQRELEFNVFALAAKLSRTLSRPGTSVKAYRVSRSNKGPDPYAGYFAPAGVLEIKVSDPQVSVRKKERTSSYLDKQKKKRTVKSTVWVYSAAVTADIRLMAAPELRTLDKTAETFVTSEERLDDKKDIGDWYQERQETLFNDAAARLAGRYIDRPALRYRPVFSKKGDKEAARAADLARRDKWSAAEAVWNKRLKEGDDWRDMLNLAVAAEVRKDYVSAREYYLKARDAAAGDKEAGAARWKEILGDLEVMLSTGAAAAGPARDWFDVPAAVLPFANETTSIDGPPMLRTLFYEALKNGGYRVQALEETDKMLLSHGLTQGGQLGAADPAQFCEWLGVERLFYGDINEFGEVMAGVYNQRMIKGRLSLWDLKERNFIWSAEPSVVKVRTPKSLAGGLFSQLARGLLERLKNKPLAYEGSLFTAGAAETLPNRITLRIKD